MNDRKHLIVTITSLLGMILATLALLGFVWNASAKNSKLETVYEKQGIIEDTVKSNKSELDIAIKENYKAIQENTLKIQNLELSTVRSIVRIDTKLEGVISGIEEIKKEIKK